jgi:ribosomal protein S18 acetylase RimI-like enzyme
MVGEGTVSGEIEQAPLGGAPVGEAPDGETPFGCDGLGGVLRRRWVELPDDYATLLAWERESWPINFPGEGFSEAEFRHTLRAGLRHHRMYLYELAGEQVGWLWLDLNSSPHGAHIRHVQVASTHWGQGIGVALVHDAIAIAREARRAVLTLNVTKSNLRAMCLYEGLGFTIERDNGDRQRMSRCLAGGAQG